MLLRFALLAVLLLLSFSSAKTFAQDSRTHSSRASHPAYAKTLHLQGVSDVGKLNDFLYRGSQPNDEGLRELKKLGVTTIIDLRGEKQGLVKSERKKAQALGMRVVNIRASGWSAPKDADIVEFLSLTQRRPKQVIFVHCWLGDDRTGVFFATYRMVVDHWTPRQAIAEMDHFHFKKFWHPAMKEYVLNFPARYAKSPAFAELHKQQELAAQR
jgi:protein tyrosine/serine phosphatase